MLRRSLPKAGSFLRRLLGRGSLEGVPAAGAAAPFRHFVEQLVGGAAPISRTPSALAAAAAAASTERGTGGSDQASLKVHFLRHSCGLEDADAAKVAERLHFRSTKNAHAVLVLLRDTLGLPPASITRLVAAYPAVLSSQSHTLGSKLNFYLRELGLSTAEMRRFLLASPNRFLTAGLDSRLRPNHILLRNLLGTDENVRTAVKQPMELIYDNLEIVLLPKLQVLRDHGVTEEVLVKLITTHPRVLVHRSTRFDEGLAAMKDLGVSPDSGIFPYAFGVFAKMPKWDRRMQNYVSLGWTEEQVRRAFVRHPYCMTVSEDKVKKCLQFIAEKLGWNPDYVASSPTILSFSHEKRVLPRYRVLDILVSRGVIKNGIKISHLTVSEKKFKENYVDRYHKDIPQVLEAYEARTVA